MDQGNACRGATQPPTLPQTFQTTPPEAPCTLPIHVPCPARSPHQRCLERALSISHTLHATPGLGPNCCGTAAASTAGHSKRASCSRAWASCSTTFHRRKCSPGRRPLGGPQLSRAGGLTPLITWGGGVLANETWKHKVISVNHAHKIINISPRRRVHEAANVTQQSFVRWMTRYVYQHTRGGVVNGSAALGQNGTAPWIGGQQSIWPLSTMNLCVPFKSVSQ
jgi:hypothetical protein